MWWIPFQRPRPTRRPDGGCTLVEVDEMAADAPQLRWTAAPTPVDDLRSTALLAAHVHADGPLVTGAIAAAAVLQRLTAHGHPRRHQAWLLQGLYHRLAGVEAAQACCGEAVVRAHEVRARSVLRLAATSSDPATARRALTALGQLDAGPAPRAAGAASLGPMNRRGIPIMARP